jgi:hypothetical protein
MLSRAFLRGVTFYEGLQRRGVSLGLHRYCDAFNCDLGIEDVL